MRSVLKLALLGALVLVPTARGLTDDDRLRCKAGKLGPYLDFEFRFVSGHFFTLPVRQFWARTVQLRVTVDVEPIGGTPGEAKTVVQHLGSEQTVPPGVRGEFNFPTAISVGVGKYRSSWRIQDISGRSCSGTRTFTAKRSGRSKHVDISLRPGEIVDTGTYLFRGEDRIPRPHLAEPRRLKVFLSLDVLGRRGRVVRPKVFHLLPQMAALRQLARSPSFNQFSVVAFSFEDRRVVFRHDYQPTVNFAPLSRVTGQLRPGQVDYRDLIKGSELNFFDRMVREEMDGPPRPHGVVFLGQDLYFGKALSRRTVGELRNTGATVAFFDASRFTWTGPMGRLVRAMDGKEYRLHIPTDLARAMSSFESRARAAIPQ